MEELSKVQRFICIQTTCYYEDGLSPGFRGRTPFRLLVFIVCCELEPKSLSLEMCSGFLKKYDSNQPHGGAVINEQNPLIQSYAF